MESRTTEEDALTVLMVLMGTGVIGTFSLIGFMKPVRDWAINQGLLLDGNVSDIRFPWDPTVGLDWGRILVLTGVVALLVVGATFTAVRRHHKRTTVD